MLVKHVHAEDTILEYLKEFKQIEKNPSCDKALLELMLADCISHLYGMKNIDNIEDFRVSLVETLTICVKAFITFGTERVTPALKHLAGGKLEESNSVNYSSNATLEGVLLTNEDINISPDDTLIEKNYNYNQHCSTASQTLMSSIQEALDAFKDEDEFPLELKARNIFSTIYINTINIMVFRGFPVERDVESVLLADMTGENLNLPILYSGSDEPSTRMFLKILEEEGEGE